MIEFADAVLLSMVQGITELLPISSTGHLILLSHVIKIDQTIFLFTLLHIASAFAILIAYRKELINILKSKDRINTIIKVVIAIIPAVIASLFLEELLEEKFYFPTFVGMNFIFWGIIMIVTEHFENNECEIDSIEKISRKQALIIGLLQTIALLPGTSRSGISTMAGMWTGVKKSTALDFSFIIGLPLLFGAFAYEFLKEYGTVGEKVGSQEIVATILTFFVSLVAIEILRRIKNRNFLTGFGIYRIVVGIAILVLSVVS